jgi:hypothetical protein
LHDRISSIQRSFQWDGHWDERQLSTPVEGIEGIDCTSVKRSTPKTHLIRKHYSVSCPLIKNGNTDERSIHTATKKLEKQHSIEQWNQLKVFSTKRLGSLNTSVQKFDLDNQPRSNGIVSS